MRAKAPTPYSLLPTPYSLLPTPYSLLPTPYSLLPTPYSLLPTPYSLLPSHSRKPRVKTNRLIGLDQTARTEFFEMREY